MKKEYSPDVINFLANLSNDEVFTPPEVANQILDTLPPEVWTDSTLKFLDPGCKTGVFLREIAKRLMEGIKDQIPDEQERIDHIMKNQIYGIAITELTALISRRSLYCSKEANGPYSVTTVFDNPEGNIKYSRVEHIWKGNSCAICGASKDKYNRDETLETHAYEFIHRKIGEIYGMEFKFDVIIGNPPYQLSDGGGTGDSAKPIYNKFVEQAIELDPKYITMIIPSRWMKGGKGLNSFRNKMITDTRIMHVYDYSNSKECFPNNDIDGGVSYFLWNNAYDGKVAYTYKDLEGNIIKSKRYLKNELTGTVIRDYRQLSIIEKAHKKEEERFSSIVLARNPFGFNSDLFNDPEKYKYAKLSLTEKSSTCKIYGVKGKKGGAKRIIGYVNIDSVDKGKNSIDKYKLFFSKAYTTTATVPPEIIIGNPNQICTETFLQIGEYTTENECINCLSYIKTKFFRALMFYNRSSINISRESFELIPLQDFSKPWTDQELYKKYNLTDEEINYIESMVKPMD